MHLQASNPVRVGNNTLKEKKNALYHEDGGAESVSRQLSLLLRLRSFANT